MAFRATQDTWWNGGGGEPVSLPTPKNLICFGFSYTTRHTYRMQREKGLEKKSNTLQDDREGQSKENKKIS